VCVCVCACVRAFVLACVCVKCGCKSVSGYGHLAKQHRGHFYDTPLLFIMNYNVVVLLFGFMHCSLLVVSFVLTKSLAGKTSVFKFEVF